jgi:SAM-dependent methyltransferase
LSRKRFRRLDLPFHFDPHHAQFLDDLIQPSIVFEPACGAASSRQWIQQRGHIYIGSDVTGCRYFSKTTGFSGPDILADAHFIPIRDNAVDVVLCHSAFEHFRSPAICAQEVMRILKPGGTFLGHIAFMEPWHTGSYCHMSPLGAMELLRSTGFEIQYLWDSPDWSGFRALSVMRSRFLLPFVPVAEFLDELILSLYFRIRRIERPLELTRAGCTGAILWIASKPNR